MKEGILTFLKRARTIYTVINVVLFILLGAAFILLTMFYEYPGMLLVLIPSLVVFLAALIAVHILYNGKIAMGTVFECVIHKNTITLRTSKKDFTYDLHDGCKSAVQKGNKYVCLFVDANDADYFYFYKRAPLTKDPQTQFSEEEIKIFYPEFEAVRER